MSIPTTYLKPSSPISTSISQNLYLKPSIETNLIGFSDISKVFCRYKEAVVLQLDAFCGINSFCVFLMFGLYLRSIFTIRHDKVYRMAMRKLNTSADILEIMGAPLAGTDLRAYVMTGGGITLKNFKVRLKGKQRFLIFPIGGGERKGLVSVEVENKKGQYDMKLRSVDVPMATRPKQRLFLVGDEEEYRIGSGLISEFEARDIQEDA